MTVDEAMEWAEGKQTVLALRIGKSKACINKWVNQGYIPKAPQYDLWKLSDGKLEMGEPYGPSEI